MQEKALASGYAVVDQTSIIATHLAEIVRQHAHELLTRQETKRLLDALAESHPKLVEELVPRLLSLGELQRVLQLLLHEQVSIRDFPAILETLLDNAAINKNPVHLVETVRQALGRSVVTPHLGTDRKLRVLTLDPAIEDELARSLEAPGASERARRPPRRSCAGCSTDCNGWLAIRIPLPRQFCCAIARHDSICGVCLSRFCHASWFSLPRKFRRASLFNPLE